MGENAVSSAPVRWRIGRKLQLSRQPRAEWRGPFMCSIHRNIGVVTRTRMQRRFGSDQQKPAPWGGRTGPFCLRSFQHVVAKGCSRYRQITSAIALNVARRFFFRCRPISGVLRYLSGFAPGFARAAASRGLRRCVSPVFVDGRPTAGHWRTDCPRPVPSKPSLPSRPTRQHHVDKMRMNQFGCRPPPSEGPSGSGGLRMAF